MSNLLSKIPKGITTKEILAVVVVTSLIWLYAEAESVATTNVETFVKLNAPEGADRVVNPVDPTWSGEISIRLQGARGSIDAAKSALARGVELTIGAGGIPSRPGQHSINLQSAIQNATLQGNTGVVVASVDPPTLTVDVESIVRIADVPVRLDLPDEMLIAGDIVIEPSLAIVTAPQSFIDQVVTGEAPLVATVRFNPSDLESLTPGVPRTLAGSLELPGALLSMPNVAISPQVVSVTLRIQNQLSEVVLPSVPVWVNIPPPVTDIWAVTIDPPFLSDITIAGPNDLIRRIESGEIRVVGTVELTSEVLEAGGGERPVLFQGLPDRLAVTSGAQTVTVSSVRRDQGEPQQP
jgi:hypothetical protein